MLEIVEAVLVFARNL